MGGDRPDWLPAGWKVIVKTRSCGRKDKYYVNPSGIKFNSKPEVFRHLEISRKIRRPREKVEIETAHALPPGWIKKTVTTKKKGKTRKDPYYIDPVSGREFRSVPEVFRYLGSPDSIKTKTKRDVKSQIHPSTRAGRTISIDMKPGSKDGVNSASSSTGENSHSKQTEDNDSAPTKLSDKMQLPVNTKEEDQNSSNEKLNIRVDERRVLRSGSKVAAQEKIDTAVKNTLKQRKRKISSITGVGGPSEQPHAKGNEQYEGGRRKSKRLSEIKLKDVITNNEPLQSGTESIAVEKTEKTESNVSEQSGKGNKTNKESEHDEKAARPSRRKISGSTWSSDSPRRTLRSSGLGANLSTELHKSTIAGKESKPLDEPDKANIKTYERAKLSAKPEILPTAESTKGNQLSTEKREPFKSPDRDLSLPKENKGAAVVVDKKKEPSKSSGQDLCLPEEHKGAAVTVDQKEQSSKLVSGNKTESSLNDLLLDPCIEFAIKTLTGEIPIENIAKANSNNESPVSSLTSPNQTSSSSALPSGDIWADPCFEFAVKTLTGDMPVEKCSQTQISFEQPQNLSGYGIINSGLQLPRFTSENNNGPSNHHLFVPVDGVKTAYPRPQEDRLPNALCSKSSENFVNASPIHGFVSGQSDSSHRKLK